MIMTPIIYQKKQFNTLRAIKVMLPKCWIVALSVLVGGILGAGIYLWVDGKNNPGSQYQSMTEYYVDFAFNENTQTTYDYYNSYTWNDIVETDAILGEALKALQAEVGEQEIPYSREELVEAIVTELPSDIRLIHTIVTTGSPERTAAIQDAIEAAILQFGEDMQEFEGIRILSQEEPHRLVRLLKTGRAVEAGTVVGFFIGLMGLFLWYGCDDVIRDAEDLVGLVNCPVLDDFSEALPYLEEKYDGLEVMTVEDTFQPENPICLKLQAGVIKGKQLQNKLEELRVQDCEVVAICVCKC